MIGSIYVAAQFDWLPVGQSELTCLRPSVHPSIRPSIHPSIRPSIHPSRFDDVSLNNKHYDSRNVPRKIQVRAHERVAYHGLTDGI